eukprot:TRINITY_DN10499_c0_g2_i3.p1 TRINITY_DN10499_c0_g2~~TRINITY_DN10499_c0_g2_i3.p1  ORF type:complete len:186 (-),score=50.52 TRINITY_DN10499_c0_g2_i3:331-888(-)
MCIRDRYQRRVHGMEQKSEEKMSSVFHSLKNQVGTESVEDVQELVFDNIEITSLDPKLKAEIERYKNVYFMSFNNCSLHNLDNLPVLPKLLRLELDDNKFKPEQLSKLCVYLDLQKLSINGNSLSQYSDLAGLQSLSNMVHLNMGRNQLAMTKDHRETMFEMHPKLQILDNLNKKGTLFPDNHGL